MAIDFKKSKVTSKSKSDLRKGKIIRKDNTFTCQLYNGIIMPIVEDYTKAQYYYSLPTNDQHDVGNKASNSRRTINANTLRIIKTYWATVKDKLKVQGTVVNNQFVISY